MENFERTFFVDARLEVRDPDRFSHRPKPIIHFPESGRLRYYSITLSALNSSVWGIVRPNALAVLRLITK